MPVSYTKVDIRGNAYPDIITEILYQTSTLTDGDVDFVDNIKGSMIFTENLNTVTLQPYTAGAPSVGGTISLIDTEIKPVKVSYYTEFDYETLRPTRFNTTMKAGAFETISGEFDQKVIKAIAPKIASVYESQFWNGIKSTTKTAITTAGTASYTSAEIAYANAAPVNQFDGVVARMLYNSDKSALGTKVTVIGTTITSANIAAEYAKAYAAIPSVVLNSNDGIPHIYAPYSHKQLINTANTSATYRDIFSVSDDKKIYHYNGVEIRFKPLAENTIVVSKPFNIKWCTDLVSDYNYLMCDKIANNRDDFFLKQTGSIYCHIVNESYNVLYKG